MKTGSQNILFDHDKQANVEQISKGLYDLCGRHISVINLLGHQNSETCQLNKGVHAFILLVSNSHHESSYRAGRQWLEKAFGEESLPYLLTVVTHESDEQCKSALTNLKRDDSFNDKRYHTCKKGMTDQREMLALLEKVDVMVQENNPSCYTRPKCEGAHEEDKIKSSEFQGNQQAKTPMVSFFRLGSLSLSKSQLINNLISSRHNTFYHRDCQGSTKTRHLMEGVAEIAWYCPAGISSLTPSEKEYFLKWTQLLIDDLTTENVSSILQNYDGTWSEVLMLKEKTEQSDQFRAKQQELEQISEKLHKATFGLEHIYREMGQIYEAHASLQKQPLTGQTDWSQYPELAAELMISGHPIELMDGDAGIQSSGKSTMLNAMFGLQFAVSAGRCTKGAFMQLLKVSDEMRDLLKFDYVLVVDTEGLRALELAGDSTLHRDNELATFVVGLGNMTLINVFGENPSEMQDVLEIVVQAFMRMKVVKLSPSCVFVHQNVADVAAAEKNMEGRRRLQEKLDKMVQLAAEEEVYDAQSFSRVISFNVQEDVKYFAQLWEGSPPMAPPNPGYSESIKDLKNFIISRASQSTGITLSQFKSKVQDLWNALLNENFVFSFKNTYEISVYRKLEVAYGNWTWTLRNKMLAVENQLYVKIENGTVDKISHPDLHNQLNEAWEKITKSLTDYFDKDGDSEVLAQWRSRFETKIKEFLDGMVEQIAKKLNAVIQQKQACKKLDERKTELEKNLLQKSKELAGSTIEASCIDSATNLADEMRCNHPVFNGNRTNLEKHMLKMLAENEDFDEQIETGLTSNKEMMGDLSPDEIKKYRLQPDQILIDQLCNCCWVTCPFCSAVCTNTVKDHSPDKHSAPFHRPNGVNSFHYRGTNIFVVESCTTLVASDRVFRPDHDPDVSIPYKQYQTAGERYASWEITSDGSLLPFWKWFTYRFQKELENHYDLRFTGKGEIPNYWGKIKKEDAIKSLDGP
ncbi:Interferon-induced very large GTPase 1 [Takifugu flavidus]|uniref:Interferon-induced very large GTPase 1 n=1 Tax=Takifugu flavidus TaxID=433684 RepID=A0A5C6NS94_9TELE|nr:Interferon-induced very large GTPase 1 [Takifugu flavidus]